MSLEEIKIKLNVVHVTVKMNTMFPEDIAKKEKVDNKKVGATGQSPGVRHC